MPTAVNTSVQLLIKHLNVECTKPIFIFLFVKKPCTMYVLFWPLNNRWKEGYQKWDEYFSDMNRYRNRYGLFVINYSWLCCSTGAWSLTKQIAWLREATLQSWRVCWRCLTRCTSTPRGKPLCSQPHWPWLAVCPPASCRKRRRIWTRGPSWKFSWREWGSSPNPKSLTSPGRRRLLRLWWRHKSTVRRRRRTFSYIISCSSILAAPWSLPTV